MRLSNYILIACALAVTGGCQNGLLRVDNSVDHAKEAVDDSVERAKRQIDDSVDRAAVRLDKALDDAQSSTAQIVEQARASYDQELKATGAEVDRLREELKKDLATLDSQVQERLDQIRTSALELSKDVDERVQARIDQVFVELHKFMTETLDRITKLIQPVLEMSSKIGAAVENGDKHLATIISSVTPVLTEVKETVSEMRKAILRVQGRNTETGEKDEEHTWWNTGLIGAAIAAFIAWRRNDRTRNGERWKPEEIREQVRTGVTDLLKSGEYDDEIAGRIQTGILDAVLLARLTVIGTASVQPVLSQGGGDPSLSVRRAPLIPNPNQ